MANGKTALINGFSRIVDDNVFSSSTKHIQGMNLIVHRSFNSLVDIQLIFGLEPERAL